jgi:hypothetical protein
MAGSLRFQDFFVRLEDIGFTDVLLPFLLIFTLIFAVLDKTKILGESKRNMNVGIALIFALIVVIPHATGKYTGSYDPVDIINRALPAVSLVVVAIVALLILIGVFAHDRVMLGLTAPGWIALFSVVTIVFIFGGSAGWWSQGFMSWAEGMFGEDVIAIVVMILIFGIIIAFVTGGEGKEVGALKKVGINLGELFGKK